MKTKVTKKSILDYYGKNHVFAVGYCVMHGLLQFIDPLHYTCGVYGWNANIYEIDNIVICAGYRPFGRTDYDYKELQSAEQKIQEIPYEERERFAYEAIKRIFKI